MKASRIRRIGLLALAASWATMALYAADAPPPYEEIVAMAQKAGEATPSLFAYRLVLRYSAQEALGDQEEAYRLVSEVDVAIRFGTSPQEAGLMVRRMSIVAAKRGMVAEGMARLMREESMRARFPGKGFGGPERGAGLIGPGLGRLSWSTGSAAGGLSVIGPDSQPPGTSGIGGSGPPIGARSGKSGGSN